MSVTRIATRYAKSLLDLAIDQNKLETVYADINTLHAAAKHRELYLMLKSPIIQAGQKMAVLKELFQDRMDALTIAYLELLVKKGREPFVPEITSEFVSQYKILKKITTVRVSSATQLSESVLADLRKKLLASGVTTENLDIEVQIDPELIGGFVLEFDNKRYDASVANKLVELKADFLKNTYVKEF